MSTKNSAVRVLRAQADKIAATIKAAERGDKIDVRFAEKIAAARNAASLSVGVVMDDKILKLDLPWTVIRETTEKALAEYVLKQMQEIGDHA